MFLSTALLFVSPALIQEPALEFVPQDERVAPAAQDGQREPVREDSDAAGSSERGPSAAESPDGTERGQTTGVRPSAEQALIPISQALGMGPSAFGSGTQSIPGLGGGLVGGFTSGLTVVINGMAAPAMPVGDGDLIPGPGWTQIKLPVPGYAVEEFALFQHSGLPLSAGKRPLLVVCHRFGVSHFDALFNTEFFEEALARGWYLLAPLSRSTDGAADINYGSAESQDFTAAGIDFVLNNYPIDKKRMYGVGFSMGGSQVMSYAARHLAPKDGMFAALVNHTGSIDQEDTWLSEPTAQDFLEDIFDGAPSDNPFGYRNASVLDLDDVTGQFVVGGQHQAINLSSTPTQLWWATMDPLQYLVEQTLQYEAYLLSIGATNYETFPIISSVHEWNTLDYTAVCDWMDQQQLVIQDEGTILADRDGRWVRIDVTGIPPETLAEFTYSFDLANSVVEFRDTESLDQLQTDLRLWNNGLTVSLPLTVKLDAEDVGDTIVLGGVTNFPLAVSRDGVPQATGWTYNSLAQELTITELDPGPHSWEFLP